MDIKPTFFIIYNPGLYGSFISWWLRYADKEISTDQLPFDSNFGNAHSALKDSNVRHLSSVAHLRQSLSEDQYKSIYLLHPPTLEDSEEDRAEINYLLEQVLEKQQKLIFIYAKDCECWTFSNTATKISNNWLSVKIPEHIDLGFWNLVNLDDAEVWQKREIIACYLGKLKKFQPHSKVLSLMDSSFVKQNADNILTIHLTDLRDDFQQTLRNISDFADINIRENNLTMITEQWNQTQIYRNADTKVKQIINSILSDQQIEWTKLTLFEEAFIQYYLMEFGYEIRCYNLDELPNNSADLKKLLYKPLSAKIEKQCMDILKSYCQDQNDLESTMILLRKLVMELK